LATFSLSIDSRGDRTLQFLLAFAKGRMVCTVGIRHIFERSYLIRHTSSLGSVKGPRRSMIVTRQTKNGQHSKENEVSERHHHDRLGVSLRPLNLLVFCFFFALAVFLAVYGWVPSRRSLIREKGTVTSITKQSSKRYEAFVVTEKGTTISCSGGLAWHSWANTCPIKQLQDIEGDEVIVLHDGKRPYEITSDDGSVLAYREFREAQATTLFLALVSVACAFVGVLKRG
jgi:hypothetical protein